MPCGYDVCHKHTNCNILSLTCRPGWPLMCSSFPCIRGPWGSRHQDSEGSVWGPAGSTEPLSRAEIVNCNSYLQVVNKKGLDYAFSVKSDQPNQMKLKQIGILYVNWWNWLDLSLSLSLYFFLLLFTHVNWVTYRCSYSFVCFDWLIFFIF